MRGVRFWIGAFLAVVGYLWNLIFFGPLAPVGWLGVPPMLFGILLMLSASRPFKRFFLQAAAKDRLILGRFRKWLRRRAANAHTRRQSISP